jgi:replicative DNA helicase
MVLMLYREEYYDPETDRKHIADLFVRKNRN